MTAGTAGAIIQKAYEDAGLCSLGTVVSSDQTTRGLDRLNDIINLWATQGLKLWLQEDVAVPLVAGQGTYTFSPTGDVAMTKPLSVLQSYYLTPQSIRQPLVVLSRDEYTRLSQVNITGAINSYFTDKQATFLSVTFWNTPDATAATGTCHCIMRTAPTTPTVSGDTAGFAPEWVIALRWALADEIAIGQPDSIQQRCAQRAGAYREALEGFDVEDAPTFFQPDDRSRYFQNSFR